MERRLLKLPVKLTREEGATPVVAGYAAVFYREDEPGTEYVVGRVHERIAPGAFDEALSTGQDVVAKFNHDSNMVLGRVSNGHLRLSTDAVGLRYEADLPDTQAGRDLAVSLQRGDVVGSSFAFGIRPGGVERSYNDDSMTVTLTDLDLGDVGPVVSPAYAATESELRSTDYWRQYEQDAAHVERDRRQRRARSLDVLEDIAKT